MGINKANVYDSARFTTLVTEIREQLLSQNITTLQTKAQF